MRLLGERGSAWSRSSALGIPKRRRLGIADVTRVVDRARRGLLNVDRQHPGMDADREADRALRVLGDALMGMEHPQWQRDQAREEAGDDRMKPCLATHRRRSSGVGLPLEIHGHACKFDATTNRPAPTDCRQHGESEEMPYGAQEPAAGRWTDGRASAASSPGVVTVPWEVDAKPPVQTGPVTVSREVARPAVPL